MAGSARPGGGRRRGPTGPPTCWSSWRSAPGGVGVELPIQHNTPYINTIPPEEEVPYPGDRALERRIKSLTRWNAMAMVVAPE